MNCHYLHYHMAHHIRPICKEGKQDRALILFSVEIVLALHIHSYQLSVVNYDVYIQIYKTPCEI